MYTQSALEWYPVEGVWVFYICLSSEAICHPGHNVKTIRFSPVSLPQTGGGDPAKQLPAQGRAILPSYYYTTDFTPRYQHRDGRYSPATTYTTDFTRCYQPRDGRFFPATTTRQILLDVISSQAILKNNS